MKVQIEVTISDDRLTARTSDGTVWFDEPALVALAPHRWSPTGTKIAAIGTDARTTPGAVKVVPAFSTSDFDPGVTSRVIEWAAMFAWGQRRPQLKGVVAALDRVEVHVEIPAFAALPPDGRTLLLDHWTYHPQVHWWLNGEKVRRR